MGQALMKRTVSPEELFPGLEDEQLWARFMGWETLSSEIATTIGSGGFNRLFARLSTMLRGKLLGRTILKPEAGLVGIDVS